MHSINAYNDLYLQISTFFILLHHQTMRFRRTLKAANSTPVFSDLRDRRTPANLLRLNEATGRVIIRRKPV